MFLYVVELVFPFGNENYAIWQHLVYTTERRGKITYELLD